jgi:hypothetical protein
MDFVFSKHAEEQMFRRNISKDVVIAVVTQPDQKIVDSDNPEMLIFQSLVKEDDKIFLIRVFVNRNRNPNVIVTVYKTTKIDKYYESKI